MSSSELLVLGEGVELVKGKAGYRGATFRESIEPKEWKNIGASLRGLEGSLSWILGDWINYGADRQAAELKRAEAVALRAGGEVDLRGKYAWALEASTLKYSTLRTAASVCRKIPLERRRDLPFAHHREVAPLPIEDQERFLTQAQANGWTVAQLRAGIRASFREHEAPAVKVGFVVVSWVQQFTRWAKGQEFEKWPAEKRAALKKQLAPLLEVFARI